MSVIDRSDRDETSVAPSRDQQTVGLVPSRFFRFKGIIDRTVAAALLIPAAPVIGLLVLLVRWTSRGPGIYSQSRVGRDGRTFTMYKIRTMIPDAEPGPPRWTEVGDPRITRIGRVLRKLHLDELPQLLNVLKGEMSLIGPRPERPEIVHVLSEEIPGYLHRLRIPPGVTGLAQINLPPDTELADVSRKLVLDLEYLKHAGFWLDVRMAVCTGMRLLGFSGEFAMRVMRLRRWVDESHQAALEQLPRPPGTLASLRWRLHQKPGSNGYGKPWLHQETDAPDDSSKRPRKPR